MDWHTWLLYLAAAIGLSLSPGPNGLLALTHGAIHGSRKALFTITGGVSGFVLVIALSMFGIGALLQASVVWLTVLKWVGGAYLVWLGIQLWRAPPLDIQPTGDAVARPGPALFNEGFLSAITNPKAILFFAAFLPQFIDPASGLLPQFAVMAGTFAVIGVRPMNPGRYIVMLTSSTEPTSRRINSAVSGPTFFRRNSATCGGCPGSPE